MRFRFGWENTASFAFRLAFVTMLPDGSAAIYRLRLGGMVIVGNKSRGVSRLHSMMWLVRQTERPRLIEAIQTHAAHAKLVRITTSRALKSPQSDPEHLAHRLV